MRKLKLKELNRDSISTYKSKKKIPLVVVLDNIRSGMNVGSFFRTSDAFLVEKIYLVGITPKPPHKELTKTAIGATHSVAWEYVNKVKDCLLSLKKRGYQIVSIEQTTDSIALNTYKVTAESKIALVFGNEVVGVSDPALSLTDQAVEIKQYGTKHSLNVSVCGGITIHHIANLLCQS
jgi:tRNA G18 (ribose-2'-O)-methylase SpoU